MIARLALVIAAFVALANAGELRAETHALVIGSDYSATNDERIKLANPVADARMVAAALQRTSVEAVTLLEDPDATAWDVEFEAYANSLERDDIALLYYAGHGFQIGGANYFLASDGASLIALDPLLRRLTERAKGVVVVVDACRDNPLVDVDSDSGLDIIEIAGATRALETVTLDQLSHARRGLTQLSNLRGLSALVFFSTEPGNVAEDGANPGEGSIFARIFAREITRRQSVDDAFRRIAIRVNEETGGRQSPWRQGDLPFGVFVSGMRSLPIP